LLAAKRIALVLVGLALVAALWIGGQSLTRAPSAGPEDGPVGAGVNRPAKTQAAAPYDKRQSLSGTTEPHIRRIAPDSIAEPEITGPLQRIAPREPTTAATKPLKREPFGPPVPQGTLLYQPVAAAAGEIESDGHDVRLAGIEVTPTDRTCKDDHGRKWPCGTMARTAFRAWIRGRAASCDVPSHAGQITTHCTLDGEDMALWLVRNGWAKSADGQYDEAEATARKEKKGLFGPSPLSAVE
jgi:endonuclease YncB( thermonuclease family)